MTVPLPTRRPKPDFQKIQSEADELAKLAQSVQPKVDKAVHGALPRDLNATLKKIEKLSKQLRRDLAL